MLTLKLRRQNVRSASNWWKQSSPFSLYRETVSSQQSLAKVILPSFCWLWCDSEADPLINKANGSPCITSICVCESFRLLGDWTCELGTPSLLYCHEVTEKVQLSAQWRHFPEIIYLLVLKKNMFVCLWAWEISKTALTMFLKYFRNIDQHKRTQRNTNVMDYLLQKDTPMTQ